MVDDRREGTNEVVKAKHILVNFNDNKDSALVVAKDIKNQVNTSNFAEKARELSQDRGSARAGGDLGYFGKNQMVQPFEEAAFGASEGSIVGPIESSFGYHIIYVEDKTSDEVSYSYIQFEPKVTKKTKQMIAAKANSLIQSLKKGEAFDSTAIMLGANINTLPRLTRQQKVLGRQSITNDLFENESGYVTPAVLVDGQGFVVAQLINKTEAGPAPFETVKNEIRPNLIKQKKMEMLAEKANDIYSQLKDEPVISDVADIDPSLPLNSATDATLNGNIPGAGKDFALSGAIMSAEIGKISGPVYGNNALYIIQVTDRYIPSEEQIEENMSTYYENLVNQQKSSNFYQWYSDYKTKMNLEDYRSRNYREF
jgi:parvulin-like peptidyl-prolyl isomerase